ncbi:trypsin-like peptidase domain-containing protein [Nonomuraea sp. NPDC049714]|uniref:trypsin-like peptidase domain-containing protein n=1 Tax=Nonomuraea sp. NPDC049714 TaxID=3364357 RepID=UPI003796A850
MPVRTWVVVVFTDEEGGSPAGSGVLVADGQVLTSAHVVPEDGVCWVSFPLSDDGLTLFRAECAGRRDEIGADVALLALTGPWPPDVEPAPLARVKDTALKDTPWTAYGFPDGSPFATQAGGTVGAQAGYGWVALRTESRHPLARGFSGSGLWSERHQAVVGILGRYESTQGDGLALTLHTVDRLLPGARLGYRAERAGELAMTAWGWSLTDDPEAGRHWRPRARGVSRDSERGHRFTGRAEVLSRVVAWLDSERPAYSALVVTGSPGVGKSAVLGRVVTTADPALRAELPGSDTAVRATPGSVGCAVHAKGKTALDVAAEIARAAGVPRPDRLEDLVTALSTGPRLNLIIDALDEAGTPAQARELITGLVVPLAETCPAVQIVVGCRRRDDEGDLLLRFGRAGELLDLDDPALFREADLATYALATLRSARSDGNPYLEDGPARPIADRIAALSAGNFLVAGLMARAHGLHDTVAVGPGELSFSPTVDGALRDYLAKLGPEAGDLLTALAFARSPGLSVELWQTAIRALYGRTPGREALLRFAGSSAANFLVESGRVYRLFHQALNDTLLAARAEFHPREDDERALAREFLAYGVRTGWASAPDYLKRSLPQHAADGGVLDELLAVDDLPLHADLMRLIPLARGAVTPEGKRRARLLRSAPQAVAADPDERLGVLSIAEALDGLGDAYQRMPHPSPYRARWARVEPRLMETVLTGHAAPVSGACAVTVDDRTLLATAGEDATVRVWDPATGTQVRTLTGHTASVTAVLAFTLAGRTVLATAGMDRTVRTWDPATGAHLRTYRGHTYGVTGLCTLTADGRTLLVSTSDDRTARIWDPATGRCLRMLSGHAREVTAVCAVTLGGRELPATASQDRTIRLWDPDTGACLHTFAGHTEGTRGHSHRVTGLCALTVDGRALLASTSRDRTIRLWDLSTGSCLHTLTGHTSEVTFACPVTVDGRTLLVTTGGDRFVRIWDPATGQPVGSLGGHTDAVTSVCALTADGHPLLATTGRDRTVHLWAADAATLRRPHRTLPYGVTGLCPTSVDDRPALVTTGRDSTVYLWDPETGEHLRSLTGHTLPVSAACALGGLLATTGEDRTVRLWDPATGACLHVLTGHDKGVTAACAVQGMLVTTGRDQTVRVWDPATATLLRTMTGHTAAVTAACAIGASLLATASRDTTVRLWDPATGLERGAFVAHERAAVTGLCALRYDHRQLLVTTSRDRTARLWDPASGEHLLTFRGHTDTVSAACPVAVEGRALLATSSYDRTVRLWDPATGSCLRVVPVQHEALALSAIPGGVAVGLTAGVLAVRLSS